MGIKAYGILEELAFAPAERRAPGAGEVEIQVRATGLNLRDVLRALGMLQDHERMVASEARFGFECTGRIAAVGAGVPGFAVGDEVIAALTEAGSLASFVTVEAVRVIRRPGWMSPEEGATIPLAFLTAWYGLERLARLRAGESVLIHAAAGGVGLAALQIARRAGARIYATASAGKRDYVTSLGVEAVLNSRTVAYGDEIRALTAGRGVDVVLNSLTGEHIPTSLDLLAHGGRFVEIGKIGIWDRAQVGRRRPDCGYHSFDLGEVAREEPGLLQAMLAELMGAFERKELTPLPRTCFRQEEGEPAFRYMAQAKHLGKIVLVRDPPGLRVRADRTYLITGGWGALGLATARHLASRGARHLALCGRGATVPAAAREATAELARAGVRVEVVRADVAVPAEVAGLVAGLAGMPPLAGVVHAAGSLDDGSLAQQAWERWGSVLGPKVAGAWNLHEATAGLPLDFFICYSSAASLLGSAGQASYAAANAFLDALVRARRRDGRPGLSVNWGPWTLGMAARAGRAGLERMAGQGFAPLPPADGFAALDRLLAAGAGQACVLSVDWDRYLRGRVDGARPPFLREVAGHTAAGAPGGEADALRARVAGAPKAGRADVLRDYVGHQVAAVLGERAADAIRPRARLFDLGVDSLMAVELRNRLQAGTGIPLASTLVFDHPTVEALADHLLAWWAREAAEAAEGSAEEIARRLATELASGHEV
jgi:NADPH:quinone reductase-like Zn-dependent oxidoreductase/acyl carrier protein